MKRCAAACAGLAALALVTAGGCRDTLLDRSLVFATHTTMGLEVAINPAEGVQSPVRLVVGYKRSEGVLNPVYHSEGVEGPPLKKTRRSYNGGDTSIDYSNSEPVGNTSTNVKRYRPDAYPVIAKFTGDVNSEAAQHAKGRLAVAQWFATGEAAVILAKQPGIAGAVSGSAEIAKEAARQQVSSVSPTVKLAAVRLAFDDLKRRAAGDGVRRADSDAIAHLAKLNPLAMQLPAMYDFLRYRPVDESDWSQGFSVETANPRIWPDPSSVATETLDFDDVVDYWWSLETSVASLKAMLSAAASTRVDGKPIDASLRPMLEENLRQQERLQQWVERTFADHPAVQSLTDAYFR